MKNSVKILLISFFGFISLTTSGQSMEQRLKTLQLENKALKAERDSLLKDLKKSIEIADIIENSRKLISKSFEHQLDLTMQYGESSEAYKELYEKYSLESTRLRNENYDLSVKLKKNNRTRNYIIGGLATALLAAFVYR